MNRDELDRILTKARNAQLDWRLQSDEPSDLIDDLVRVCEALMEKLAPCLES